MLLFSLLPGSLALASCRMALAVAYIWSGIQKLNARFFQVVPSWFVAPAERWHVPASLIEALRLTVAAAPVIELAIGLALWLPRLRKIAIGAAVALHLSALLFLGPLGYNYNWVVWPWNLAMIGLLWSLFAVPDPLAVEIAEKPFATSISVLPSEQVEKERDKATPQSIALLKQTFLN